MTDDDVNLFREIIREELKTQLAPLLPMLDGLALLRKAIEVLQRDVRSLRDDMTVTVAILNRVDHSQSNFIEELRAMRTQQESVRKRVETLEHNG